MLFPAYIGGTIRSSRPAMVVQFLLVVNGKKSCSRYDSWNPWAISSSPDCPLSSLFMISSGTLHRYFLSSGMSLAYLASFRLRTRLALQAPAPCAVVPVFIVPSWRFVSGLPSKSAWPFSNAPSMSCRIAVMGLIPILWCGTLFSSISRKNAGNSMMLPGARYIFSYFSCWYAQLFSVW